MSQTSDNSQLAEFADNLWTLYLRDRVEKAMSGCIRHYRATVTANPGGNRLTVTRPFDNPVTLPCTDRMRSAAVGAQVTVLVFGSYSNAIVAADGDFQNF